MKLRESTVVPHLFSLSQAARCWVSSGQRLLLTGCVLLAVHVAGSPAPATISMLCRRVIMNSTREETFSGSMCLPNTTLLKDLCILYFEYSRWANSGVIVSGEQWRDSAIHSHVSVLLQTPLPSRPPQNMGQSSLRHTVGPPWLSILNTGACACPSQTPGLSLPPSLSSWQPLFKALLLCLKLTNAKSWFTACPWGMPCNS